MEIRTYFRTDWMSVSANHFLDALFLFVHYGVGSVGWFEPIFHMFKDYVYYRSFTKTESEYLKNPLEPKRP